MKRTRVALAPRGAHFCGPSFRSNAGSFLRFAEMQRLVECFGFRLLRVTASHHIYGRPGIPEQINLQNVHGKAKPYQVRQLLRLVERYNIQIEGEG